MARRIHFVSLGCPKNLVDGEVMQGLLVGAGHRLVLDPAEADVLVVNTCSFIDEAKVEAKFDKGVLHITAAKKAEAVKSERKIPIGGG